MLDGADRLAAHVDLDGTSLALQAELGVSSEAQARDLAKLVRALAGTAVERFEEHGLRWSVDAVGANVVVRASMPVALFAQAADGALREGRD
jgi:hypothetical protein